MKLLLISTFLAAASALHAELPIRVLVQPVTSASGVTDATLRRRQDSRADLPRELRDKRLAFVDNLESADITVEVVSSAYERTGETQTTVTRAPSGSVAATTRASEDQSVIVRLTAGDDSHEFVGEPKQSWMTGSLEGTRTRNARDAPAQIKRWARENETQLLARRQQ